MLSQPEKQKVPKDSRLDEPVLERSREKLCGVNSPVSAGIKPAWQVADTMCLDAGHVQQQEEETLTKEYQGRQVPFSWIDTVNAMLLDFIDDILMSCSCEGSMMELHNRKLTEV